MELQASAIHPQQLQQPQEPEQLRLRSSLSAVWSELQSRAGSTDFVALLQQVFGPGRDSTAQALADHLAAGDQLGLHVELLSGSVMAGAMGAYAAAGPDGQPTIYINADWLQGASDADLRLVLLEEIGHRFDTVMNGGVDTAGDEGQSFAALFSGQPLSADQRAAIADTIAAIKSFTGRPPRGWESPGLTETDETLDLLAEAGIEYVADWVMDEQPVTLATKHGPVVSVPYTVEINDVVISAVEKQPSEEIFRRGRDQFDRLYLDGATAPRVMAISIHPYLTGVPHRIKYLEMLYDYILGHHEKHGGVVMWTGAEILDWYSGQTR